MFGIQFIILISAILAYSEGTPTTPLSRNVNPNSSEVEETTVETQDVSAKSTTKDNFIELSVTESIIGDIETTLSSLNDDEFNSTETSFNSTPSSITYDSMMDYMAGKKMDKKEMES